MAPIKRTTHRNNKEYCNRYREKNKEKYKQNDAERKRYQHMLTKLEKPGDHEEQKKKNRERKLNNNPPNRPRTQASSLNKTIQVPKFTSCRGEPFKQSKQEDGSNWITCKKVQHENST